MVLFLVLVLVLVWCGIALVLSLSLSPSPSHATTLTCTLTLHSPHATLHSTLRPLPHSHTLLASPPMPLSAHSAIVVDMHLLTLDGAERYVL